MRLWVNGVQLINDWTSHGPLEQSGTIALIAGQKYDLKMDYYDDALGAIAQLKWSCASTPQALIPASQIYPDAATPPPGGNTSSTPPSETSGKCGLGGGIAAMLMTLALSLRLRRRSLV